MGKSTVDKDALVPSKKLAFLTGILGGITETVKAQKAKEIEQQKQQFQFMKFYLPLLQKQRQFETEQKTELSALEQRQSQFETEQALALKKFDFTVVDAERERDFQIQRDTIRADLDKALKQMGITDAQTRQSLDQFFQGKMAEMNQMFLNNMQEDRQRAAEALQKGEQAFETSERLATQRVQAVAGVKTDLDKALDKVQAIREELAKDVSPFGDKEQLAKLAKEKAAESIELWKIFALEQKEAGKPIPPIPPTLEVYKDESFIKRALKIVGSTEFGVEPKQSPAQSILQAPKAAERVKEVQNAKNAVKGTYGADVPEFVIQGLRNAKDEAGNPKFTEEEVQRIIGNGRAR